MGKDNDQNHSFADNPFGTDGFNPFANGVFDPLGPQQTNTPSMDSYQVKGTEKLVVVIFVVDTSLTMEGERIGGVNGALRELKDELTELKNEKQLNVKIAVMSFTHNAKWVVPLTDIEELYLEDLAVRPGLTEYGVAFKELDRVLSREQFLKYNGSVAKPVIMFMTDGEPDDSYEHDLDKLLENKFFTRANRSVLLMGDAILSESAKKAVSRLVTDPEHNIVAADSRESIRSSINLETMRTLTGKNKPGKQKSDDKPVKDDPTKMIDDTFGAPDVKPSDDPFGAPDVKPSDDTFGTPSGQLSDDPFGNNDPFGAFGGDDPFSNLP